MRSFCELVHPFWEFTGSPVAWRVLLSCLEILRALHTILLLLSSESYYSLFQQYFPSEVCGLTLFRCLLMSLLFDVSLSISHLKAIITFVFFLFYFFLVAIRTVSGWYRRWSSWSGWRCRTKSATKQVLSNSDSHAARSNIQRNDSWSPKYTHCHT